MKKFRILISIFIISLSIISFRKIWNQTNYENVISKNSEYLFRWWDLVEIKKNDKKCSSKLFKDTSFLKISCKDYEIAKWLIKQKGASNIDILSVVPAQALFYKLKGFESSRLKYLTITWNDFSNREKALLSINKTFDLINDDCSGNKRIVFILLPTSVTTMDGSMINFTDKKTSIFSQAIIEDKLINYQNKCIKRNIMKVQEQDKPLAHWIEFKIFMPNDKIL